jgi:hypothetical protein
MLVLLQGTFTPLVHAHAGRTQARAHGTELYAIGYHAKYNAIR